jgi:hypothetical protein
MTRRDTLSRPVMEAAIARGLTVDDLAIERSVCVRAVYRACRRFHVLMAGQQPYRPKPYRRARAPLLASPVVASATGVGCSDCGATVLPARGERTPVRCSMCVARRSLALIALKDELRDGEMR